MYNSRQYNLSCHGHGYSHSGLSQFASVAEFSKCQGSCFESVRAMTFSLVQDKRTRVIKFQIQDQLLTHFKCYLSFYVSRGQRANCKFGFHMLKKTLCKLLEQSEQTWAFESILQSSTHYNVYTRDNFRQKFWVQG